MATTTTTTTTTYADKTAWHRQMACLPPALQWAEPTNLASVGLQEATFEWKGHAVHVDRFDVPDSPVQLILLHGTCVTMTRRGIGHIVGLTDRVTPNNRRRHQRAADVYARGRPAGAAAQARVRGGRHAAVRMFDMTCDWMCPAQPPPNRWPNLRPNDTTHTATASQR